MNQYLLLLAASFSVIVMAPPYPSGSKTPEGTRRAEELLARRVRSGSQTVRARSATIGAPGSATLSRRGGRRRRISLGEAPVHLASPAASRVDVSTLDGARHQKMEALIAAICSGKNSEALAALVAFQQVQSEWEVEQSGIIRELKRELRHIREEKAYAEQERDRAQRERAGVLEDISTTLEAFAQQHSSDLPPPPAPADLPPPPAESLDDLPPLPPF